MFKPVPMQRLSTIVLERDEHAVLRGLGRLGAMHLVLTKAGPDTAPFEPPDRRAELSRCDDLLTRIEAVCRKLEIAQLPDPSAEPLEIALDQATERLQAVETRASDLLARHQSLQQRWGHLTALKEQVTAYEGLELPLDRIGQFSFLHFALGSLPPENLDELQAKVGDNVVLLALPEEEGQQHVVAVTSRKGRFALETALEQSGFHRDALAVAEGQTAERLAAETRREHERVSRELAEVGAAVSSSAAEVAQPLADLEHLVRAERQILDAEQIFPHTDATVFISGWVPAEDVPMFRRALQEMTGGRCVIEAVDPVDVPEHEIPVLLRHPRLLRPFEMLVSSYGLPGYRELEPTLFVAVTFLVMFGMMFGDVGQGGVLLVSGIIALLAGRSEKVRDFGILLALAGGSSVIFGTLYGEYFGLPQMKRYALWRDPLAGEAMGFLWPSIMVGVGIISLGLVLNIVNRFRRGDYVGGFFDKFGVVGAFFYWGVLALGLKWLIFHQKSLHWLEFVIVIVLPLAALFLKEPVLYALHRRAGHPREGSFFEVLMISGVEVFEAAIVYMANTISFVRLAAYAMSHAALLAATFLLAREVSNAVGTVGGALGLAIIILGNVFAILLEGLIAGIQALRLEYYEFFGKFFSGSGKAFQPFRFSFKAEKT